MKRTFAFSLLAVAGVTAGVLFPIAPARAQVLFQHFYYPIDKPAAGITWWQQASQEMAALQALGVYSIWHPVPTKGGSGAVSMGYDPYDLYDLGSKDQKGTIPTNFGTKDQYLNYIATAHAHGIRVYADVVLNHTGGADTAQPNPVMEKLGWDNIADDSKLPPELRPKDYTAEMNLRSWTNYSPKGADGSPGTGRFPRNWQHFHPNTTHPDHDEPYHKPEFGEDYCYFSDNGYVGRELNRWGNWFRTQTGVDGMRLDAVKLADPTYLATFAETVTKDKTTDGKPFFLVGEFWDTNHTLLANFQKTTGNRMSLFDFGLFYGLWDMTEKPAEFDMRDLLKRRFPDRERSVSFVSNHDVDRFQPIRRDKRALPYAITMTMSGMPSVFYLDFFKPEDKDLPEVLKALVPVHNRYAVGKENIRHADADTLVIERERNLIGFFNDGGSGEKTLTVQTAFGRNRALREVGKPAGSPLQTQSTDNSGKVTVTVPAGGYVLLVAEDARNTDRFANRPLSTTQVTEFADDLDRGRLNRTPQVIPIVATAGKPIEAVLYDTAGAGTLILEIRDGSGNVLAIIGGQRGRVLKARVDKAPSDGVYRILVTAPGEPTEGKVRITYTGIATPAATTPPDSVP